MEMSWKSTFFSRRQARTLDTAVDMAGPYTFTGVAIGMRDWSWMDGVRVLGLFSVFEMCILVSFSTT
jgi:hypothetical protein